MQARINLEKLRKEKETMQGLMHQYRNEAELNKKLREDQTRRAIELENDKRNLESRVANK